MAHKRQGKVRKGARVVIMPALDGAPKVHYCAQCGRDMGGEWILGPVCGKCCRENHRRVMGGGS